MRRNATIIFLIPSLLGFLVFFLIPLIGSLSYVFNDNGVFSFANLANTVRNEAFSLAFTNTIRFMLVCVPLNLVIPLLIAIGVRYIGGNTRLLQMANLSPLVVPVASVALFWSILFAPGGSINQMLAFVGLGDVDFLSSGWALPVIALITLWKNLGYMMVLYLAGLSEIPQSYYRASQMDGAGSARGFFYVTLPCLRPTLFFVLVLSVINCFKVFREIYLIAGAYPHESIYMLQHYMNNMFVKGDYTRLTSAAFIIMVLIVAFLLGVFILQKRGQAKDL